MKVSSFRGLYWAQYWAGVMESEEKVDETPEEVTERRETGGADAQIPSHSNNTRGQDKHKKGPENDSPQRAPSVDCSKGGFVRAARPHLLLRAPLLEIPHCVPHHCPSTRTPQEASGFSPAFLRLLTFASRIL